MAAADNTPNFDSMSPEEINRWLESLAKRQGASDEELTTSADMDIAEIDPNTVVIDEPGYVPYGEERPPRPQAPVESRPAPPPRVEPAPTPQPEPQAVWRTPPAEPEPVAQTGDPLDGDALAWLESLAAGQGDALFNLDLSALTDEIDYRAAERAESPTDPMAWLKSLASEDATPEVEASPAAPEPAREIADPFEGGVDPMAWLENLARRQGARDEELTTHTEMAIPVPENPVIDEPGYTPFSFDAPIDTRQPEPEPALDLEDPSSWLGSLADAQGFDAAQILATSDDEASQPTVSFEIADIEQAIAEGTVTPEQMQVYLEHETDVYVDSLDDMELPEAEALPVPAELPDWLLDQVGPPPSSDESEHLRHLPPLSEVIAEPPPVVEMPDWLTEDLPVEGELDFDSIFANSDDALFVSPDEASGELTLEVDPDDPWVEAFDAEQDGQGDHLDAPPDWYVRNLNDPQRVAAVEGYGGGLMPASLPEETDLPAGEMMALPEWLSPTATAPTAEATPDWLAELEADIPSDAIPDWLVETMEEPEAAAEPLPALVPAPPAIQPAPVQRAVPPSETLATAREQARSGQLSVALDTYETLVRATQDLDSVVADLQSLVRQHRSNPAVFRVLGDGLMRQGNLQSALDTYREALNLL